MPNAAPSLDSYDLVVAGGGAAGFFGAITAAESAPGLKVLILEKSREVLGKVRISGGGRCNVTHACFDPRELSGFYPRGSRQLIGPFHRWGPTDTIDWFEGRGVPIKTESDGRMFPESNTSQSIIDCLTESAANAGIEVRTSNALKQVNAAEGGGFEILTADGSRLHGERLLLTLGGTRNRIGADLAEQFGHKVKGAAPSLFTFKITDPRIEGLQGLAVPDAEVAIRGMKLKARGPVLVTHWGLSGPGILKVSAWGARELHECGYRFDVKLNWTGDLTLEEVREGFARLRSETRKKIVNDAQFGLPSRLWRRLVESVTGDAELTWPHLTKAHARTLALELVEGAFSVDGKSMNKDEFVTCGGVDLSGVNFKSMESKVRPGLFFAGEILDIDGVTGGFNFQAAWTTGRIAGESVADRRLSER